MKSSKKEQSAPNVPFRMTELALSAKQYKDALVFLREALRTKADLSIAEISVFSQIFKGVISSPRNALIDVNEAIGTESEKVRIALEEHRAVLRDEISAVADDALNLIDSALLPTSKNGKCIVFLNKLKGDYYRYLAEVAVAPEVREGHAGRAKTAYETALLGAGDVMSAADPLYLGLVLNYTVFQFEIQREREEAVDRLDASFNEAIRFLEELNEREYKEAAMMLQLMRDNIQLWRDAKND